MKNKTYIIAILLFCVVNLFAEKYLINSYTIYKDNVWQKIVFNYNSDKQVANTIVSISTNLTEWENYTYSTRQYKNGAVSEICDYIWDNEDWVISKKQLFEYSNDKITSHSTTYSDIQKLTTYKYNNNTITQKQSFSQGNTLKSTIVTLQKTQNDQIHYIKTYSVSPQNDTLFSQITTFDYTPKETTSTTYEKLNTTYNPTEKTITTFNNNNISSETQYKYEQNNWTPTAKQTYYYNSQNQVTEILYQTWENNFWSSDYKRLYTYNQNGSVLSSSVNMLQYKEWEVCYQINYNYNYNNQLDNASIEQSFWSDTDKEYSDYISLSGNNIMPFVCGNNIQIEYSDILTNIALDISSINVYPNPSKSGIVFIDTDLIVHDIAVFDINGILLYQNKYTNHVNLSHLNNGMYIIQITTNEGKYSFKQIINNY